MRKKLKQKSWKTFPATSVLQLLALLGCEKAAELPLVARRMPHGSRVLLTSTTKAHVQMCGGATYEMQRPPFCPSPSIYLAVQVFT